MSKLDIKVTGSVADATKKIDSLSSSWMKMGNQVKKGYGSWYSQQRKINNSLSNINKDANRASDSIGKFGRSLNQLVGASKMYLLADALAKSINASIAQIETINLFNVAMGDTAEHADLLVQKIHDIYGFDSTNLQSAIGTFALLARSMGMGATQAEILSSNTAKLAYDLSSLTNVPINQVMADLKSGLVGQSETVYKYGIDITEASLKTTAFAMGIDKSVRNMSQGEKVALRYATMLKQTTLAQGDFARTINTPANQLKVLSERFVTLQRAIGNMFLYGLGKVLPYVNAFISILTDVANKIAIMFGYVPTQVKNTANSMGAIGDEADSSADSIDKMGKAIKNATLGIDELNVIDKDAVKDKSGGGASILEQIDLSAYDNLMDKVKGINDELKTKMIPVLKEILVLVGLISVGMLSWKLSNFLLGAKTGVGLFTKIKETIDMIKKIGFLPTLIGFFPEVALASGIFSIISGIVVLIKGLVDILNESGFSWKNFGIAMAGVGVIALGFLIILGGIPALIALAVGAIVVLGVEIYKHWEEIKKWTIEKWGAVKQFLWDVWLGIGDKFDALKERLGEITSSIKEGFSTKWNEIKTFFTQSIPEMIEKIRNWWSELPNKIAYEMGFVLGKLTAWEENVIKWIIQEVPKIISSIVNFFIELPNKIKSAIDVFESTITQWVTDATTWIGNEVPKIVTAIVDFFASIPNKIKEKIDGIRNTIIQWKTNVVSWVNEHVPVIINSIIDWFIKLPDSLYNIGVNMIKGIWNGIMSMGNWLVNKLKNFWGNAWTAVQEIWGNVGSGFQAGYTEVKKYATGGFPEMGNMFIANESGAEMIGDINGKTAVVNNDQIVEAVSTGVARAVASVMNKQSQQPLIVELDGEVIYDNQQKISGNRGYNFGMGVFAR